MKKEEQDSKAENEGWVWKNMTFEEVAQEYEIAAKKNPDNPLLNNPLYLAALSFLMKGYSIVPIKVGEKRPHVKWRKGDVDFVETLPTQADLATWWIKWPDANIAILAGETSGKNLSFIDFDDGLFYEYCKEDLKDTIPKTIVVKSGRVGGGWHLWLWTEGSLKGVKSPSKGLLDLKKKGGYVLAPPSLHKSGANYEWVNLLPEPLFLPIEDLKKLMETLRKRVGEWGIIGKVIPLWEPGQRHDLAMGIAGMARKVMKWDKEYVSQVMGRLCHVLGDKLGEEYSLERLLLDTVETTYELDLEKIGVKSWFDGVQTGLYDEIRKKVRTTIKERFTNQNGKVMEEWVATHLMGEEIYITLDRTKQVLRYVESKGIYDVADTESFIEGRVEALLGDKASEKITREVISHIRRKTYVPFESMDRLGERLICVENGLLDPLKGEFGELIPHTPDRLFSHQMPGKFDPTAKCPTFLKHMKEIRPEKVQQLALQEAFGFTLLKDMPFHRTAHLFVGEGGNGKGVLLKVLEITSGPGSVSHLSPGDHKEKFLVISLKGKLANIRNELPTRSYLAEGGVLFEVLAGDEIEGEIKNVKYRIRFRSFAKHFYAGNILPKALVKTRAFFRRIYVHIFTVKFSGKVSHSELVDSMTTPVELSGILNWKIVGLRRLLEQRDFTGVPEQTELDNAYTLLSDPVSFFVDKYTNEDDDGYVLKSDFSRGLERFRQTLTPKFPKLSSKRVSQDLRDAMESVWSGQIKIGDSRPRAWRGLSWNEAALEDGITWIKGRQPPPKKEESKKDTIDFQTVFMEEGERLFTDENGEDEEDEWDGM